MNCKWVKDRLSAFIDGEVSPEQAKRIEDHLASCTSCADEVAAFRKIAEVSRTLHELSPSDYFETKLKDRLREEYEYPPVSIFRRWRVGWAIAVPVLLLVGYGLFRHNLREQPQPIQVQADYYYMETEPTSTSTYFVVEKVRSGGSDETFVIPAAFYGDGSL